MVPPPRQNLVRYHGVLAPACPDRAHIVPGHSELTAPEPASQPVDNNADGDRGSRHGHRISWSKLLARVFQIDVQQCPACGGRLKILAALTDPASVRRYLEGVGLPSRAPPLATARIDEQLELDDAA